MKTIILTHAAGRVKQVYAESLLDKLEKEAGLLDRTVFRKDDILENPELFADTEYIFSTWGMPEFSKEEIRQYLPKLKCVFYSAGSVQSFARPFLELGVKVFSAWAANAVPVAEYTVAQIVLANTGFYTTSRLASKGEYRAGKDSLSKYIGNYDAKVGIIGAGMIGKLVISMLKAYKLDVLVFDPFLPEEKAQELGVQKTSLEELFATCNVVSNHLADNEQTRGMLKGEHFEKMLPYATFINTGRGAQIVESELQAVLAKREDLTALLDVTKPEPPEEGSPFYTLENCILTPHIAGSKGNERLRLSEYMVEEYERYAAGEATRYEVNLKMLETMA